MDEYAGFALVAELAALAEVNENNIALRAGVDKVKVCKYTAVRVEQLPEKYRPEGWHDLGAYLPSCLLTELLGVSTSYFSLRIRNARNPLPHVRVGRNMGVVLVPTTAEFRALLSEGKMPFQLRGNEKYADIKTRMHGFGIGWY